MSSQTTLSTVIDSAIKKAATKHCNQRGIKLQYFVEQAIVEQLEDEIDIAAYHQRKDEETVPLEQLLNSRKSRKKS